MPVSDAEKLSAMRAAAMQVPSSIVVDLHSVTANARIKVTLSVSSDELAPLTGARPANFKEVAVTAHELAAQVEQMLALMLPEYDGETAVPSSVN